jgi:hypothetical protein
MTDEIQAAAERYAKGDSPYWHDDGTGRLMFDSELRNDDLCTLADAYRDLGERQEDRLAIYKGSEHYCGPFENPDAAYETVEAYGDEFRLVRVVTFISPVEKEGTAT